MWVIIAFITTSICAFLLGGVAVAAIGGLVDERARENYVATETKLLKIEPFLRVNGYYDKVTK